MIGMRGLAAVLCIASVAAFSPAPGIFRFKGASSNLAMHKSIRLPVMKSSLRMDLELDNRATATDDALMQHALKKDRKPVESKVVVVGLSHKTTTVEVREKLAVQEPRWQEVGRALTELPAVSEAAVLSTCNRFEIYFVTNDVHQGIREVTEYLSRRSNLSITELRKHLFMLSEGEAVWHGLRVAAGLDSLVIGEGQILSQIKRCYELSTEKEGAAGKILGRMLNTAVSAGKRIRSETGIARGGVSISSAAVELVEKRCIADLGLDMSQLDICILGAGKMARLLVQHLIPRNVKSITILNRSPERSQELANSFPDFKLNLGSMDEMLPQVAKNHVTFACTGAMEPILFKANLEPVIAKDTILVDISVPRNVDDVGANLVPRVHAYNVDDLKAVVASNQARRRRLVLEAEDLLQEELSTFANWKHSLATVPMINKLQMRAERIRKDELRKADKKLSGLSVSERDVVDRLTKGIVAKLLHGPMSHLKTVDNAVDINLTVKSLEAMFKL